MSPNRLGRRFADWLTGQKPLHRDEAMDVEFEQEKEALLEMLKTGLTVIYKHSSRCSISSRTAVEVARFEEERPDVPLILIDVVDEKPLARFIAQELKIRHQSPQVIVVRDGVAVWDTSHFSITAGALLEAIG
jgi:bacillithiol system protein YtxJ